VAAVSSHSALQLLRTLSASSYGPAGKSKIIRASSDGALTITSTSHRIFGAIRVEQPLARVLLELTSARQAGGADGGLFTLLLATELLLLAERAPLSSHLVSSLLPEAMELCTSFLLAPECAVVADLKVSDLESLLALMQSVLSPKRVALPSLDGLNPAVGEVRQLAFLIVSAFVQSIGSAADYETEMAPSKTNLNPSQPDEQPTNLLPGVRLLAVVGGSQLDSELLVGVVLDTPFFASTLQASCCRTSHLAVALYNVNLEPMMPTSLSAKVSLTSSSKTTVAEGLHEMLAKFAKAIENAGISLVACQQRVAPALVLLLNSYGISVLARLSLRHIGAVQRLTGATPISEVFPGF